MFVRKMPCLVAVGKDSGGAGTEMGFMDITILLLLSPRPSQVPSPQVFSVVAEQSIPAWEMFSLLGNRVEPVSELHSGLLKGTFCGTYRSDLY